MAWSSGYCGHPLLRHLSQTTPLSVLSAEGQELYYQYRYRSVASFRAGDVFPLCQTASGCAQRGYAIGRHRVNFTID